MRILLSCVLLSGLVSVRAGLGLKDWRLNSVKMMRGMVDEVSPPASSSPSEAAKRWHKKKEIRDDFVIRDFDEDEQEGEAYNNQPILCIAPPCGIKMEPVPLESMLVDWALRLKPPPCAA